MSNTSDTLDEIVSLLGFESLDFVADLLGGGDRENGLKRLKAVASWHQQQTERAVLEARIEELNLLDNGLFPYPRPKINLNKLKDYKSDRIKELNTQLIADSMICSCGQEPHDPSCSLSPEFGKSVGGCVMSNTELREKIADICRTGHHKIAETKVVNQLVSLFEEELRQARVEELRKMDTADNSKMFLDTDGIKYIGERIAELEAELKQLGGA